MSHRKHKKFRDLLDDHYQWPIVYMFKFIVPNNEKNVIRVRSLFNDECEISRKKSSKANYISFTVKKIVFSSEEIIKKYEDAAHIHNLIAL